MHPSSCAEITHQHAAPSSAPLPGKRKRGALLLSAALLLLTILLTALGAAPASAHPLSTSAVLLDIRSDTVAGTIQIPLDRLAIALDEPLTTESVLEPAELGELRDYVQQHIHAEGADASTWTVQVTGGSITAVDDVDHLVFTTTITLGSGEVTDFTLFYDAVVEHLLSHQILVSARAGSQGDYTSVGLLDWSQTSISIKAGDFTTSPLVGFLSSMQLGFTHITEGADHLLFLLMLLLPAPLLAQKKRWKRSDNARRDIWRIVHVVTAFAVGHSITLALGAFGLVDLPTRVIESLIALSVIVSGVHAIRPLVARGEVWIAGTFGLMHGLAFAALLNDLDLGRGSLVADLLGFNIGIELTQLAVVALVMPSLLILSRTRFYTPVRRVLAGLGVVLAFGWLAERTTLIAVNPLEPVGEAAIDHPFVVVAALSAGAIAAHLVSRRARVTRPSPSNNEAHDSRSAV